MIGTKHECHKATLEQPISEICNFRERSWLSTILSKGEIFVIFCIHIYQAPTPSPEKKVSYKKKQFAPNGSNVLLFRVYPFQEGNKKKKQKQKKKTKKKTLFDRITTPETGCVRLNRGYRCKRICQETPYPATE